MEFMNRTGRPAQPASAPAASSAGNGGHHKKQKLGGLGLAQAILCIGIIGLLISAVVLIGFGRNASEARQVEKKQLQAVFLNGGQVYFGNIQDLNGAHIRLTNIYYLRVNQQVQPNQEESEASNDISLVKLGCELHGPEDEMLINREQVIFWENLKTDGQVAEAVAEYQKQNPNGQDCDAQSGASGTSEESTEDNQ